MVTSEVTRQQIYQTIENLPEERLPDLLHFLEGLLESTDSLSAAGPAPIYQIHCEAISTGVSDLAHQHDHYLYGLDKRDA